MINNELSIKLISNLTSINLDKNDFAIFGNGPMFAHGIRQLDQSLQVIARGRAWEQALLVGNPIPNTLFEGLKIELFNGQLIIFNTWGPGEWHVNSLIDTATVFNGIRYISLANVIKWKQLSATPSDLQHIKHIQQYLRSKDII